ncbi:MAG: hypothetical protein K0R27_316 [Xanthobacteraceae bacterium]|nr:hypothetical protein [Xanthobacteraceae bacterium]
MPPTTDLFLPGLGNWSGLVLAAVIAFGFFAPLWMSIAAESGISIVTSIVLLTVAAGIVFIGKAVTHEILAAIVYMAALLSASSIFAAHRSKPPSTGGR